jgi:nucleoside-diphosphate-sugar epimerase
MESLGWKPKISLRDRIKDMVQWSLENDKWLK